MKTILLINASLSLFLSLLVFIRKKKTYSNYLLAIWLVFVAVHLVAVYLQWYNFEHNYPFPWLIGINISFIVIHPIWIFLYILSFVRPEGNRLGFMWHLIPVIILNLILLKTFYLKSDAEKINILNMAIQGNGLTDKGLDLSIYLVISITFAYMLSGYWLLRRHMRKIRNHFSTIEGIDLKWLRVVLYSLGCVVIVAIALDWISNHLYIISPVFANTIIFVCVGVGITYIGLHGIRQTEIFVEYNTFSQDWDIVSPGKKNIFQQKDDQTLIESITSEKYEKLISFMVESKPYLDSNLNLSVLAEQLGFKSHFLSQLINQKAGKNFFDFVNEYRIDEFKKRIRQPGNQNYTLLSIAYECGFNSKTTFNRVFKNHSGYTPSEFFLDPQKK